MNNSDTPKGAQEAFLAYCDEHKRWTIHLKFTEWRGSWMRGQWKRCQDCLEGLREG